MNSNVRKHVSKKPVIILLLMTICILFFLPVTYVSAAAVGNTTNTTNNTVTPNTPDTPATGATATDGNTADTANTTDAGNLNGSLGPLDFTLNTNQSGGGLASTLQMLLVLTVIALAPSLLIMVTSFTRIVIVLHFVRSALGTQTTPPNQIIVGLALFLTFFVMSPVITQINTNAVEPLSKGEITQEEAFDKGVAPLRTFMLEQTNTKDLKLFLDIAKISKVDKVEDIPISVIIPSFIISELRTAFIIGFLIYIPFIVIDMVVASTLMSMGMMMLPPTMISMPFKILLFIMADGWNLIIGALVKTFY